MVLSARSAQHPDFPETKEFVRVAEYTSQMVIRPHGKFEDNGFDYVMSYCDNPHLYVPSYVINKLTLSSKLSSLLWHNYNWRIDNPFVRPSKIMLSLTTGGNLLNVITYKVSWANQKLNLLCTPGYAHLQCFPHLSEHWTSFLAFCRYVNCCL